MPHCEAHSHVQDVQKAELLHEKLFFLLLQTQTKLKKKIITAWFHSFLPR